MARDNRARITQIQNDLDAVETKLKELQHITDLTDSRFTTIKERMTEASSLKNQISTIKTELDDILSDAQLKQTQVSEIESSIEELVEEAEESKQTFEKHTNSLIEIEGKIKNFEDAIVIQLGRAGAGALALAFTSRQTEIEGELKRWREILYWSVGAQSQLICMKEHKIVQIINHDLGLTNTCSL